MYLRIAFTTTCECAAEEQASDAADCSAAICAGDVAKMRGAGFRIMGLLESDAARREAVVEQTAGTLPRVRSGCRGSYEARTHVQLQHASMGTNSTCKLCPAPYPLMFTYRDAGKQLETEWTSRAQVRGDIAFRDVRFRHAGRSAWTLDGVSFSIDAGSTVALVGPSGSGALFVVKVFTKRFHAEAAPRGPQRQCRWCKTTRVSLYPASTGVTRAV